MLVAAIVVLTVLLAALATSVLGRARLAPLVVGAAALAWPFVNHPLEGPVLWTVARGHGLTLADLLTPCALLVAAVVLLLRTRRSRSAVRGRQSGASAGSVTSR